jgi:hypothetical protein
VREGGRASLDLRRREGRLAVRRGIKERRQRIRTLEHRKTGKAAEEEGPWARRGMCASGERRRRRHVGGRAMGHEAVSTSSPIASGGGRSRRSRRRRRIGLASRREEAGATCRHAEGRTRAVQEGRGRRVRPVQLTS